MCRRLIKTICIFHQNGKHPASDWQILTFFVIRWVGDNIDEIPAQTSFANVWHLKLKSIFPVCSEQQMCLVFFFDCRKKMIVISFDPVQKTILLYIFFFRFQVQHRRRSYIRRNYWLAFSTCPHYENVMVQVKQVFSNVSHLILFFCFCFYFSRSCFRSANTIFGSTQNMNVEM